MPFDIVAFLEASPGTGLVKVDANGVGDDLYKTSGDDLWVKPNAPFVLGAFVCTCSTGEDWRLRQPKLPIDHQKFSILNEPGSDDTKQDPSSGYQHMFARPLKVWPNEKLNGMIQNATDEEVMIALLLGTRNIPFSMIEAVNPHFVIKGESDDSSTAAAWSTISITWDQDLPMGTYIPVGFKYGWWVTGANRLRLECALARLLIPGNTDWRPGVPGMLMEADHEERPQCRKLECEKWPLMRALKFDTNHMPDIEVLSPIAVTDHNVELEVVKIG